MFTEEYDSKFAPNVPEWMRESFLLGIVDEEDWEDDEDEDWDDDEDEDLEEDDEFYWDDEDLDLDDDEDLDLDDDDDDDYYYWHGDDEIDD